MEARVDELTVEQAVLGADLGAARRARREAGRFLDRLLDETGVALRKDDVLLVISELVTNSVVHAQAAPRLIVRRVADPPRVLVEVHDPSPVSPIERDRVTLADIGAEVGIVGGRGMRLVSAVADAWGVEVRASGTMAGKTIWAEFRVGQREVGQRETADAG